MANQLDHDPLFVDTTVTGVKIDRIQSIKYVGAGTPTIVATTSGLKIWSTTATCFDYINVTVPGQSIDITVPSGSLYIYRGSGPR